MTLITAYQWKRGERSPGVQAQRLFLLHRNGRVLGDEWEGWSIKGDRLVDPDGNETTQDQFRAYWPVYQAYNGLKRQQREEKRFLDGTLLDRLSGLSKNRRQLAAELTRCLDDEATLLNQLVRIERDGSLLPIRVDFIGFGTSSDFSAPYYVFAKGEHSDCPLSRNDPSQRISDCHRRIWLPITRERYRACRVSRAS